jgi:hypothetical protein
VRIAAVAKVAALCKLCSSEASLEQILPSVKELAADNNQHVRAALASVIMALAPVLGKAATIDQLVPLFLALLKDEWPDVRHHPLGPASTWRCSWRRQRRHISTPAWICEPPLGSASVCWLTGRGFWAVAGASEHH